MIKFEFDGLEAARRALDQKLVRQAEVSMLNRIAAKAATAASRQIREKYEIAAKDLRKRGTHNRRGLDVIKARFGSPEALVLATGYALPLINFRVNPKTPEADRIRKRRKGVRYQVQRGKRVQVKGGFIAKMRSGHIGVFQREGKMPLPIRELFGPSIPQMFGEQQTLDSIFQTVAKDAASTFEHELRFRLQRAQK